ncbi:MAG TPA: AlkA N-terminal domain-containing protein [Ktedonobacteraceae bacterium]|jgi:DNA-3-methyladenine glycosylase II
MQRMSIELTPLAPYNFALALTYLQTSPSAILERIEEQRTYRRAMHIDGRDVLLSAWSVGTVQAPRLVMELAGADLSADMLSHAAQRMRNLFSLESDPEPFQRTCARDPVFGRLLQRYCGLRPVLIASPYEALIWAIIGQQVNVAFARKLKQALVNLCGLHLSLEGVTYPLLPRPHDVANLDERVLRALEFSSQKAAYLVHLSQAVAAGDLDFSALGSIAHPEAVSRLMQFKGIGRWTAEYVLMRGLGAGDSLPAADPGLRAIIGRSYGLGRTASEAEVRAFAEAWTGWRGWAAFYWWLTIQQERQST